MAAALPLGLAACSSDEPAGAPAPRETQAPVQVALEDPVHNERDASAEVQVLDVGSGDKQQFTYAPALGDQPTVTVTFDTDSQVLVDGRPQDDSSLPERRALLAQQVEADVNGAQRATVTFQELSPTTEDSGLDELLASGRGFAVTFQRAAAGAIEGVTLEAPVEARNVARQSVEQLTGALADATVILPEEPIGEGARWTVTRPVQDAVAPDLTTTYTLLRIDGNSLTVAVDGEAKQTEDSLSMQAADGTTVQMQVEDYASTVSGELKVSLTEAVPFYGTLKYETTARYRGTDGRMTETSNTRELKFG